MDIHTAAQRYEDGRHFWAREIALSLKLPIYKSRVTILRQLSANGTAMTARACLASMPAPKTSKKSQETALQHLLVQLTRDGVIKRTRISRQNSRSYWYTLTELGALVLTYIPKDHEDSERLTETSDSAMQESAEHAELCQAQEGLGGGENTNNTSPVPLGAANKHRPPSVESPKQSSYRKYRAKGLCGQCGKTPPRTQGRAYCQVCIEKQRIRNPKYRTNLRKQHALDATPTTDEEASS